MEIWIDSYLMRFGVTPYRDNLSGVIGWTVDYVTTSGSTQRTIFFCTKVMVFWTCFDITEWGVDFAVCLFLVIFWFWKQVGFVWLYIIYPPGNWHDNEKQEYWRCISYKKCGIWDSKLRSSRIQGPSDWWTCEVADVRSSIGLPLADNLWLTSFLWTFPREKMCITWAPTSYNLGHNSTYRGLYKYIYSGLNSIYNLVSRGPLYNIGFFAVVVDYFKSASNQ